MRRAWYIPLLALAVVSAIGAALWLRSSLATTVGTLEVAGDVRSEIRVVRAPALTYPVPDFTVGIPKPPSATLASGAGPAAAKRVPPAGASRQPTVSGTLAEVYVSEGAKVTTGQVLARLDTSMLDLGVAQARTAAAKAHADVAVMRDNLSTLARNRTKLATAKSKLTSTLAQVVAQRAQIAAQLAQLEAAVAHMPPGPPPTPIPTGPPSPAVLIPKLRAALVQIDTGLAKLRKGLGTLATGSNALSTARTQVSNAREVLTILADAQDLGVGLAQARLAQATMTSPVSGTVTYARPQGQLAMVGTPVMRIRPDGPLLVDTYLTADQLAQVSIGTPVTLTYDSAPGVVARGRISMIGTVSTFPPTAFPTSIVHMTRATRVTVTLDDGVAVPYGTPVDLTISTR